MKDLAVEGSWSKAVYTGKESGLVIAKSLLFKGCLGSIRQITLLVLLR